MHATERCGRCGGRVRLIRDAIGTTWAHVEPPARPHRPVLGTPAATIQREDDSWTTILAGMLMETVEEQIVRDPIPAPEVVAEVVELDDERVPPAARSLGETALAAGNHIRVTYSRGPFLGANGSVLTPQASNVMVKVQNIGVAVWQNRNGKNWNVETVFAYQPLRTVNVTELTRIITSKEH